MGWLNKGGQGPIVDENQQQPGNFVLHNGELSKLDVEAGAFFTAMVNMIHQARQIDISKCCGICKLVQFAGVF